MPVDDPTNREAERRSEADRTGTGAADLTEEVDVVADVLDGRGTIRAAALDELQQGDRVLVNDRETTYVVVDAVAGEHTLPVVYLECERSSATFVLETRERGDLVTGAVEERVVLVGRSAGRTATSEDVAASETSPYGEPVERLCRRTD